MTESPGTPSCAVIVATRDRGPKIVPLLDSIMASDLDDFELVVVDQSIDDATETALLPFWAMTASRTCAPPTTGLSRARNLGISSTTAPYLVITDDDCIVPPEWLRAITAPHAGRPRGGAGVLLGAARAGRRTGVHAVRDLRAQPEADGGSRGVAGGPQRALPRCRHGGATDGVR